MSQAKSDGCPVSWFQFQELQDKRGKYCDDLQSNKCEISELTRMIQKLQCELESVKKQVGDVSRDSSDTGQGDALTFRRLKICSGPGWKVKSGWRGM